MDKKSLLIFSAVAVFIIVLVSYASWQKSEIEVISYQPLSNNITINDMLSLQFNSSIEPSDVLAKLHIDPPIEYDWSYNQENKSLTIKPLEDLEYNTTYTVTVDKGVKSSLKKPSTQSTKWSFTTLKRKPIKIALWGDILLYQLEPELAKGNPHYAFEKLNNEIVNPENFIIGNLENPISDRGTEKRQKNYRFRAKPATVEILTTGGVKAVSLANNHALDYGPLALTDTVNICEGAGITCFGHRKNTQENNYVIVEFKSFKIGLLSYVDKGIIPKVYQELWQGSSVDIGVNYICDSIIDDVKAIKERCDFLVVALHWGIEGSKKVTNEQVELAHKLIESGVDIIAGHHPHAIQGIQKYKNGLICYSLGNFIFPAYNKRNTFVPIIEISKDGIIDTTIYPLKPIKGIPNSMNEVQASSFYKELKRISLSFNTEFILNKDTITVK